MLLVEGNRDVEALVSAHLGPENVLTIANGGRDGIKIYKDGSVDLVLRDIQMPEIDGYEATRVIRFCESRNDLHPASSDALTSFDSAQALSEILDSGYTTYSHKPATRSVLLQTVSQYFRASQVDAFSSNFEKVLAVSRPAGSGHYDLSSILPYVLC